ncbi:hypothetical protein ACJMK2_019737 [Sinanodonta woodiana]|uniref:Archaemetzincin-2 n=1 Tax=Sinanodonta woodiana TaxID=1069815 RepID=A0ABD3U082_SINWO
MGTLFSAQSIDKDFRYLIGDLDNLSSSECRFYRLSEIVLKNRGKCIQRKQHHDVGQSVRRPGQFNSNELDDGCNHSNKEAVYHNIQGSGCSLDTNGEENIMDRCATDVNVQACRNCEVESLYKVLPLNKPLYTTQTYVQWYSSITYEIAFSKCRTSKRTIYFQPINSFPDFIQNFELRIGDHIYSLFGLIRTFAEYFFWGMDVQVLPSINIQELGWNITTRVHPKTGKQQYLVSDFYSKLRSVMPKNGYCIMGITWTDLYPKEELNFVLGEASGAHKSGVFSFGRFEPKSYNPEMSSDIFEIDEKILWRLLKVMSHEVCHIFGLNHCEYFLCAMNESTSLHEAMSQPLFLCPVCLRKLQTVCKFDLIQRFQILETFLSQLNRSWYIPEIARSIEWLQKCLCFFKEIDVENSEGYAE